MVDPVTSEAPKGAMKIRKVPMGFANAQQMPTEKMRKAAAPESQRGEMWRKSAMTAKWM
jgi:hypothetical protein